MFLGKMAHQKLEVQNKSRECLQCPKTYKYEWLKGINIKYCLFYQKKEKERNVNKVSFQVFVFTTGK